MNYMKLVLVLLPMLLTVACSSNIGVPGPERQASSTPGIWPSESPVPVNQSGNPTKSGVERPPPETWNFSIKAGTYVFYAKYCWKAGDDVVIRGYWANDKGKWAWYDGYRTLSAKVYSPLNITTRDDSSNQVVRTETYLAATMVEPNRILTLRTVQSWEGTDSREIKYRPPKTPWVVNGGYQAASGITSRFTLQVFENRGDIRTGPMPITNRKGITSVICEKGGDNYIVVEATGSKWWIKVGVEP